MANLAVEWWKLYADQLSCLANLRGHYAVRAGVAFPVEVCARRVNSLVDSRTIWREYFFYVAAKDEGDFVIVGKVFELCNTFSISVLIAHNQKTWIQRIASKQKLCYPIIERYMLILVTGDKNNTECPVTELKCEKLLRPKHKAKKLSQNWKSRRHDRHIILLMELIVPAQAIERWVRMANKHRNGLSMMFC